MDRRSFIGSLAALAAGMALDPERALWVPGRRTYFDTHVPQPQYVDYPSQLYDVFMVHGGPGGIWRFPHDDGRVHVVGDMVGIGEDGRPANVHVERGLPTGKYAMTYVGTMSGKQLDAPWSGASRGQPIADDVAKMVATLRKKSVGRVAIDDNWRTR